MDSVNQDAGNGYLHKINNMPHFNTNNSSLGCTKNSNSNCSNSILTGSKNTILAPLAEPEDSRSGGSSYSSLSDLSDGESHKKDNSVNCRNGNSACLEENCSCIAGPDSAITCGCHGDNCCNKSSCIEKHSCHSQNCVDKNRGEADANISISHSDWLPESSRPYVDQQTDNSMSFINNISCEENTFLSDTHPADLSNQSVKAPDSRLLHLAGRLPSNLEDSRLLQLAGHLPSNLEDSRPLQLAGHLPSNLDDSRPLQLAGHLPSNLEDSRPLHLAGRLPSNDSIDDVGDFIETDFPSKASRLMFASSSNTSSNTSTDNDSDEG